MLYNNIEEEFNKKLSTISDKEQLKNLKFDDLDTYSIDDIEIIIQDVIEYQLSLKNRYADKKKNLSKKVKNDKSLIGSIIAFDKKYRLINKKIKFLEVLLQKYRKTKIVFEKSSIGIDIDIDIPIPEKVVKTGDIVEYLNNIPTFNLNPDISSINEKIAYYRTNIQKITRIYTTLVHYKNRCIKNNLSELNDQVCIKLNDVKDVKKQMLKELKNLHATKSANELKFKRKSKHKKKLTNTNYSSKLQLNDDVTEILDYILGYSINDKIKEFDRIVDTETLIETLKKYKDELYHNYFVYINRHLKTIDDSQVSEKEYFRTCKYSLNKILKFLDKYIRHSYQKYHSEVREKKRRDKTDLNSLPLLSDSQNILFSNMKENFPVYSDNLNDLLITLSCYIKKSNLENTNMILNCIDMIIDMIGSGNYPFDSYNVDLNFLRNSIKYKINSYDKNKNAEKREFLKNIGSKLNSISYVNLNYSLEEIINMDFEDDMKIIFRKVIFENQNALFVKQLLDERPDLCYLTNEKGQYFFKEVLEYYINIVLNSKETNNSITYFGIVTGYYIDCMMKFHDKYVYTTLLRRLRKVIEVAEAYDDLDKQNFVIDMMNNIIYKITGKTKEEIKEATLIMHNRSNNIITLDSPNAGILENAFSINKVSETTINVDIFVPDLIRIVSNNNKHNFTKVFQRYMTEKRLFEKKFAEENISLKSGEKRRVIAYHFVLDMDMNIIDFNVRNEIIRVYRNVNYENIENTDDVILLEQLNNFIKVASKVNIPSYHKKETPSIDNLNSYFNIFFNSYIANKCYLESIPCLYTIVKRGQISSLFEQMKYDYDVSKPGMQALDMLQESYSSTQYTPYVFENSVIYGNVTAPVRNVVSLLNQIYSTPYLMHKRNVTNKIDDMNHLQELCERINEINGEKTSEEQFEKNLEKTRKLWNQ